MAANDRETIPDLDERKAAVLRAIVTEYVASGEPIGSSRVVAVAGLDVSAATVRSDMGALEELELIAQPHTSAGRIPTERGYRWFVDTVLETSQADASQRKFIRDLLDGASDAEDLLQRAVTGLAQLTRLVALVLAPRPLAARVKLFELVQLHPTRLLAVIADDTGGVLSEQVVLGDALADDDLMAVRESVVRATAGVALHSVGDALAGARKGMTPHQQDIVTLIKSVAEEAIRHEQPADVIIAGRDALAGQSSLDRDRLRDVLRTLDDTPVLAEVLRNAGSAEGTIRIGAEHELQSLSATALVGAGIHAGSSASGLASGSVGVLGPVRMDYVRALATVRAVADELHSLLGEPSEADDG